MNYQVPGPRAQHVNYLDGAEVLRQYVRFALTIPSAFSGPTVPLNKLLVAHGHKSFFCQLTRIRLSSYFFIPSDQLCCAVPYFCIQIGGFCEFSCTPGLILPTDGVWSGWLPLGCIDLHFLHLEGAALSCRVCKIVGTKQKWTQRPAAFQFLASNSARYLSFFVFWDGSPFRITGRSTCVAWRCKGNLGRGAPAPTAFACPGRLYSINDLQPLKSFPLKCR